MVVEWVLLSFSGALLLPVSVLLAQVLLALIGRDKTTPQAGTRQSRAGIAVLVPAHDESAVIADTLGTLLPQLNPGDRLLVVADNCTDDTASLARAAGAEVIERSDTDRRGKSYALDFGVRHLAHAPPEVLIVVDADCRLDEGAVDRLARVCIVSGRPVQALYLMRSPEGAGLKARLAEFAWLVKNQVRPLGYHALGLPCQLMGTGMAFPWQRVAQMNLANADIVEDMKLGIDLALAGAAPVFCPEARVTSVFPATAEAVVKQRTRWEHGHMGMILREFPRLAGRALVQMDLRLLAMAMDLAVPPLALLAMLLLAAFALAGLAALTGVSAAPLIVASLGLASLLAAILLAWIGWGRRVVSLIDLLSVPFYVLAKLPLYLKFITQRQKEWVRTDRK